MLSLLIFSAGADAWVQPSRMTSRLRLRTSLYASSSQIQADFLCSFCGDFDNYHQVVRERQEGLLPREGGGHEHIHCALIPVAEKTRLAAYYFDANPKQIFRFRYYEVCLDNGYMKLYTLTPALEGLLRKEDDPMKWSRIFQDFSGSQKVVELPRCDVQWSSDPDPSQHQYALQAYPNRQGYHAVMVHGEAVVESTVSSGMKILIRDQLSLWEDELWIHDRGFDPETMKYIYGNQRGVPYQLQRVSQITSGERFVVSQELRWTLGSDWRTEEEYLSKMNAINKIGRTAK